MLFIVCPSPSLDCFATATPGGISVHQQVAGGSGIRVGRSLRHWDTKVQVIAPLGGFNGYHVRQLLKAEGLPTRTLMGPIPTQQHCYTHVNDQLIGQKIAFSGHNPQGYAHFEKALRPYFKKAKTLVLCGPLPPHFPEDSYAQWMRMAHTENPEINIYMSAPGHTLQHTLGDAIIPLTGLILSRREWEVWTGRTFSKENVAQHSTATASQVTHTVVTDGANPVIGHLQGQLYTCSPPTFSDGNPNLAIGNKDAFMAGFVWALAHQQLSATEALQAGTLSASYHCFGKALSRRDLRNRLHQVELGAL